LCYRILCTHCSLKSQPPRRPLAAFSILSDPSVIILARREQATPRRLNTIESI
jgi:hypothetical protein